MFEYLVCSDSEKNRMEYEKIILNASLRRKGSFSCRKVNDINKLLERLVYREKSDVYIIESSGRRDIRRLVREIRTEYFDNHAFIIIIDFDNTLMDLELERRIFVVEPQDGVRERMTSIIYKLTELYSKGETTMLVCEKNKLHQVPLSKIIYIEKEICSKYCNIVCEDKNYRTKETLQELEKKLDRRFVKTHRSSYVNLDWIKSYDKKQNIIEFKNNNSYNLISREGRKSLINEFTNQNQEITIRG